MIYLYDRDDKELAQWATNYGLGHNTAPNRPTGRFYVDLGRTNTYWVVASELGLTETYGPGAHERFTRVVRFEPPCGY